ncbi:SulP family inorganic anion transporter [Paralimibaculum aggregatum]|uniref:SulP family inorganic anion transporter n=1 Tax=Paralimibaculum aggregatum TaxID=3036245 RepID=A0ABQ6LTL7_9RHOB|nr:SulP family inorganic anion transporter [Limibaculum sp. NKW23]GMG85429.1 SulP family inorganic anion transporter [Limibaculum sp. NKW23]
MDMLRTIAAGARHSLAAVFARPDWFSRVTPVTLRRDLLAGLTGATIVLPQGVAFAAIAGLPPEYGFYTALITPVVAGLLGSSWHAVSGPTTAISALVFGALSGLYAPGSPEFLSAAVTLALLVGLMQLMLGLARLGVLVSFVSHSVMIGFVTAAALLIALSQLRHALGLELPRPEHLDAFFPALIRGIGETDPASAAIAALSLASAVLIKRWRPGWPNYLIALALGTGAYVALGPAAAGVATVGRIDTVIPAFALPPVSPERIGALVSPAFAIALVGLLEAMSISRAIALRSGQDIDANREFTGQGMSNIAGSFFSCYPGSASFTRSGVNYEAGAETPLAAIFAAGFLFLILLLVAPWFAVVPIPAMAGVILVVAWRLVDTREVLHILKQSKGETAIAAITFLAALFIELEFSIYCGVILSILLFVDRSSKPRLSMGMPDPARRSRSFRPVAETGQPVCPQLGIVGLDGPLFFGSVDAVRREFRQIEARLPGQTHLIFNIRGVGQIDLPAAELLIEEAERRRARGGALYLQTKIPRTIAQLRRFGVTDHVGGGRVHPYKSDAIAHAITCLDRRICATCSVRAFHDCPPAPEPGPEPG